MAYTGPKVRLSRRIGIALTPKAARYLERRPYPPGHHGTRRATKPSPYKLRLLEKQKLRYQYDIPEGQLRRVVEEARRRSGQIGEQIVLLLEHRLDALVLRAGLARTIYQARQLVSHGHVEVDNQRVDRRGYRVHLGQTFRIRPESRAMPCFRGGLEAAPPPYLEVDEKTLTARLAREPLRSEIPVICKESLVIEFYSR